MTPIKKLIAASALLAALAGIFYLYGRPEFLMTIANQLWTCF
jgi:hypothetical protein